MSTMHRFFVPPDWLQGHLARLEADVARQAAAVLRLAPPDEVVLLDDTGWEHRVRLESVSANRCAGTVVERRPAEGEPTVRLALYQGLLKGEKLELVLQKGTELGVSEFTPTVCQRNVPQVKEDWEARRWPRWRRIITEAAEQSRRGRLPRLHDPVPFAQAVQQARGLRLIPWEEERATSLRATLRGAGRPDTVSVFIGPEGGFTPQEVEQARSAGVIPVSLGPRILRAETAALAVAAVVMYELGEMGNDGGSPYPRRTSRPSSGKRSSRE